MIREPAAAGFFYSDSPVYLKEDLEKLIEFSPEKVEPKAIVAPHAGYQYSGKVAGKVYGKILPPDLAIVLGPNHTGVGEEIALFPGSAYKTPLGEFPTDKYFLSRLPELMPEVSLDFYAHLHEHSIEVQIPFLQYINPQIAGICICLKFISFEKIYKLGEALSILVKERPDKRVLIVASSDFSHYVPDEIARRRDKMAIERILNLDEEGLVSVVIQEHISMCGVIPVAVAIVASKLLGATKGELIAYQTSGDVTGDYSSVVGYAGIIIE